MAPRRPKGNIRRPVGALPNRNRPHRHPDLPVLASEGIAAGNVCIRKYLEDGRDWRKLTPAEVLCHFLACNLPAVSLRRPKRDISGPAIAAAAAPVARRQGLLAAVATGILQAVDQGFYWSSVEQKREGVRMPMSRLVHLPTEASKEAKEMLHDGAVCTVSESLAIDVCMAHACQEDATRRVALVRITSHWNFTVKHLEMDPLWLRSSYLKALFEMERQIHAPLSSLEDNCAIYTSDVSLLRGPLEEGAPWLSKAQRMDVIWLNLQRNPHVSEKDDYLNEEERRRVLQTLEQLMRLAEQQGISVLVFPPPRDAWHPSAALGELLRDAAKKSRGLQQVIVCKDLPDKFYSRWSDFTNAFLHGVHEVIYDKDLEDRQAVVARLNLKSRSSLKALDRYVKSPFTPRLAAFPPKAERSPKSARSTM